MMLIYLLKVSACIAIFFAAYQLLLAKLTFFKLNRTYLLFALMVSFIIPALTIENKRELSADNKATELKAAYGNYISFEENINDDNANVAQPHNWKQIIEYGYYAVLIAFLLRILLTMGYIRYAINKFEMSKLGSVVFVKKNSKIKNCTFLNKIIIDSSLTIEEQKMVIRHESVHVKQGHGFDKLLVNIACCILWFNPIIYLWRIAIDNNHEFLADEEASETIDKNVYASLLLNLASQTNNSVANNFSKLPLKNRIMMMYKKPNNPVKRLTYFAVIPLVLVCSFAFINRKEVIVEKERMSNQLQSTRKVDFSKTNYFLSNGIVENNNLMEEQVLIIDAGHGGKDNSSVALDGQKEKDLNLRAVMFLKEEALKRGIKVVLTRSDDRFLSLRDRLPQQQGTAFISIHHNSKPITANKAFDGIEVYVSKLNRNIKGAERLGTGILSKLNRLDGMAVRDSLGNANLLLLRDSKMPSVLIEMGNIADGKSSNYINNEKNIRRISNLILDGFESFFKAGC